MFRAALIYEAMTNQRQATRVYNLSVTGMGTRVFLAAPNVFLNMKCPLKQQSEFYLCSNTA